jgi:hypothetical protein
MLRLVVEHETTGCTLDVSGASTQLLLGITRKFEEIKSQLDRQTNMIRTLLARSNVNSGACVDIPPELNMPISNAEGIEAAEVILQDVSTATKLASSSFHFFIVVVYDFRLRLKCRTL